MFAGEGGFDPEVRIFLPEAIEMDALSEALNAVRMTGAIFYSLECSAPWGFSVPHLRE